MTDRSWNHWHRDLSHHLQENAVGLLIKADEFETGDADLILSQFFEVYGLMQEHCVRIGTIAQYLSEMPPEPSSYVCEEAAEDATRILDMVRSPEMPSFPLADLPAVADACIERAMAYLRLARTINAGELEFPKAFDPPRTGPV